MTDSKVESEQQNRIVDLSGSIQTMKQLFEEESNNIQTFIQTFLSQLPQPKYHVLQGNSAILLDADLLSRVCQKGPSLLEPRTFVNLMTLFASVERSEALIYSEGGVSAVLNVMKKEQNDVMVQQAGARTLALLAEDDEVRAVLGHNGALIHLVEIVLRRRWETEIDNRTSGDVSQLHEVTRLRNVGLLALANLVFQNESNKELFVKQQGIERLLELMARSAQDQTLLTYALLLLRNLCTHHTVQNTCVKSGVLKEILLNMRAYVTDESIQVLGLWALVNLLTAHRDTQEVFAATTLRGVEVVMKAMQVHYRNEEVQEMGCVILGLVAKASAARILLCNTYEVVPLLIATLRNNYHHGHVLRAAVRTLWRLGHNDETRVRIGLDGAIPALIALLVMDRDKRSSTIARSNDDDNDGIPRPDPLLHRLICWTLLLLAKDNLNKEIIKEEGGIEAFAYSLHQFALLGNRPIQRLLSRTMYRLFEVSDIASLPDLVPLAQLDLPSATPTATPSRKAASATTDTKQNVTSSNTISTVTVASTSQQTSNKTAPLTIATHTTFEQQTTPSTPSQPPLPSLSPASTASSLSNVGERELKSQIQEVESLLDSNRHFVASSLPSMSPSPAKQQQRLLTDALDFHPQTIVSEGEPRVEKRLEATPSSHKVTDGSDESQITPSVEPDITKQLTEQENRALSEKQSQIDIEMQRQQEEEKQKQQDDEMKRKQQEEEKRKQEEMKRREQEEEMKRRQQEEEKQKQQDEEMKRKQQEEEKRKQEEMKRREQEEEIKRRQQEEEMKRRQQEEEMKRRQEEEIKRRQQEEEMKRRQKEEMKRRQQEEEMKRRQQEEEMKRRQQEEEMKRRQQEEEMKRRQQEEERRRQQEEEMKRKQEIKRRQEEEMKRRQQEEDEGMRNGPHRDDGRRKKLSELRWRDLTLVNHLSPTTHPAKATGDMTWFLFAMCSLTIACLFTLFIRWLYS